MEHLAIYYYFIIVLEFDPQKEKVPLRVQHSVASASMYGLGKHSSTHLHTQITHIHIHIHIHFHNIYTYKCTYTTGAPWTMPHQQHQLNRTYICGSDSPCLKVNREEGERYYSVGPPYLMHKGDMVRVTDKWTEFVPRFVCVWYGMYIHLHIYSKYTYTYTHIGYSNTTLSC
ncbi:hypothetical protein EON63_04145 [archaeon]|nr:MAG: hypothetical protein EON63_04145 [archaeon]